MARPEADEKFTKSDIYCRECRKWKIVGAYKFSQYFPFCEDCKPSFKFKEYQCLQCQNLFKTWDITKRYCKTKCRQTKYDNNPEMD